MIQLAGTLGWLSPPDQRAELVRMIGDLLVRRFIGSAEVDLTCSMNRGHELDQERATLSAKDGGASAGARDSTLGVLVRVEQ